MKIYVASSWGNEWQPRVVDALRQYEFTVYDFRHPAEGEHGFHWSEIDPDWESWTPDQFVNALQHRDAVRGFDLDFDAMTSCDACLLVLPCGRSAHLELGWAAGQGKTTGILYLKGSGEPELMYRMVDHHFFSIGEAITTFKKIAEGG